MSKHKKRRKREEKEKIYDPNVIGINNSYGNMNNSINPIQANGNINENINNVRSYDNGNLGANNMMGNFMNSINNANSITGSNMAYNNNANQINNMNPMMNTSQMNQGIYNNDPLTNFIQSLSNNPLLKILSNLDFNLLSKLLLGNKDNRKNTDNRVGIKKDQGGIQDSFERLFEYLQEKELGQKNIYPSSAILDVVDKLLNQNDKDFLDKVMKIYKENGNKNLNTEKFQNEEQEKMDLLDNDEVNFEESHIEEQNKDNVVDVSDPLDDFSILHDEDLQGSL